MRIRLQTSVLCLGFAILGGCETSEGTPPESKPAELGACDQAALANLAKRLDSVEPEERVAIVSEDLLGACEALLPPTTAFYLREVAEPSSERALPPDASKDEALGKAKALACPKLDELDAALRRANTGDHARTTHEVCDYGRYGVIPVEVFATHAGTGWMTWTTHALLLDAGTPPEVAATITRAMFLLETAEFGLGRIAPIEGQRLPKVPGGTAIPEGIAVYASMTEMIVNEQLLVALQDGVPAPDRVERHLILPLYERLMEEADKQRMVAAASGEDWEGRMLLAFDRGVPFSTVVDTLYTGGRVGFANFAFIIQPAYPVERALLVAPPRFTAFGEPTAPPLKVFITDDRFYVRVPGEDKRRELPKRDPAGSQAAAWDQAGLAEIVDELVKTKPTVSSAVVSAENSIPLEVVLGTYATLAGPGCDQAKPRTCRMADLIIEAGAG